MGKIVYVVLGVLAVISYITTRNFIIDTNVGNITVSNITLTFVLLFGIVGGVSPWLARKWFPKAKVGIPFTMSAGLTFLFVVSLLGYTIKSELKFPLLMIMIICYLWTAMSILKARKNEKSRT